jgi:phosphatidylinositol glycan class K
VLLSRENRRDATIDLNWTMTATSRWPTLAAVAFVAMAVVETSFVAAHDSGHSKRMYPLPIRPGKLTPGPSNHTDQWAVIVSTSRFWHNYRHATNALEVYRVFRDSGVPDSHIVLMLADDIACEPRNVYPSTVHGTFDMKTNTMCADVEVDFSGDSVTAINFLRVLTGRMPAGTAERQQIFPGPNSNVFIYLTGHSGAHFMKFHDYDFMTSYDLGDAVATMHRLGRYHRLLFSVDTCQAETIFTHIDAPDAISLSSSAEYQNSLSHPHHYGAEIGNTLVDGFAAEFFKLFFNRFGRKHNRTSAGVVVDPWNSVKVPKSVGLIDFFASLDRSLVMSDHVWSHERDEAGMATLKADWKLRDFVGPGTSGHVLRREAPSKGRAGKLDAGGNRKQSRWTRL